VGQTMNTIVACVMASDCEIPVDDADR
jgi:hypothetical protein